MGRRIIYIRNPSSGSHFRTIDGEHGGGGATPPGTGKPLHKGWNTPKTVKDIDVKVWIPRPPVVSWGKSCIVRPKVVSPKKPDYGAFQKYGELWDSKYTIERALMAKRQKDKLKMLKSIAKKLAKMAAYTGPNPALAIQAYLGQMSEAEIDALELAKLENSEMKNMLYPKYGDPKAFLAGLLIFAGAFAGEAFATTTMAEHAAWDTQSFGGFGMVYDKGILFTQAGPIANPITGATMTAEQIAAIQSIPTGLSQAETLGQLFTILAAP